MKTVPTPPLDDLRGLHCLTVHQPWAELIVSGRKWAENRTWSTHHRGTLGVHAGRTTPDPDNLALGGLLADADLPLGVLVGTVEVVDCLPRGEMNEVDFYGAAESLLQPHGIDVTAGREFVIDGSPYVWLLANPVRFETPAPRKGQTLVWRF